MRGDEPDLLVAEAEMLAAFDRFDLLARHFERAGDPHEREGIRFAADLDEQRAQDRKRERQLQLKLRAFPWLRRNPDAAANLLNHGLHDIEPDAAPGDLRDAFLHRKAGEEQELKQLRLGQLRREFAGGELFRDDGVAESFDIDSAAIVRDLDE